MSSTPWSSSSPQHDHNGSTTQHDSNVTRDRASLATRRNTGATSSYAGSDTLSHESDDNGSEFFVSHSFSIVDPRHRVSPRAPIAWTFEAIWFWSWVALAQVLWYFYGDNVFSFWNQTAAYATGFFAALNIVVVPWWRYRILRWDVSDDAVYALNGWWTTHRRIAPLSRLQTVYTKRSIFERWFGLATTVASTASAHGSVEIKGLDLAEADRLAAHLNAIAQLEESDAT